jgi:hypothetical protein
MVDSGGREEPPTAKAELNFALLPTGEIKSRISFLMPGEHSRDVLNTIERLACLATPIVTVVVAAAYQLSPITIGMLLVIELVLILLVVRPLRRKTRRRR